MSTTQNILENRLSRGIFDCMNLAEFKEIRSRKKFRMRCVSKAKTGFHHDELVKHIE